MAEISGGVYCLPLTSTDASPFWPRTILYGTRLVSSVTSSERRPMNRLIEKIVFCGLVTACRLATCPTSRSPSFVNATTDGVVRPPSALGMTTGSPPSITATTEFVVPRSIPMIFSAMVRAPRPGLKHCRGGRLVQRQSPCPKEAPIWQRTPVPPSNVHFQPHVSLQRRESHRATRLRHDRHHRAERGRVAVRGGHGQRGTAGARGVPVRTDSGRAAAIGPAGHTRPARAGRLLHHRPAELLGRADFDVHTRRV